MSPGCFQLGAKFGLLKAVAMLERLTTLGVRHTRIHPGRPQTNEHIERLHKTVLDECWRPSFERYLYVSYGGR